MGVQLSPLLQLCALEGATEAAVATDQVQCGSRPRKGTVEKFPVPLPAWGSVTITGTKI